MIQPSSTYMLNHQKDSALLHSDGKEQPQTANVVAGRFKEDVA